MSYKNKRIIAMLIASGILLSPNNAQAMESTIDFINEDSNVPDLINNQEGYEIIRVTTTGGKS